MKIIYDNKSDSRFRFIAGVAAAFLIIISVVMLMIPEAVLADSVSWPNSVADANAAGRWPAIEEIPAASWLVMDMQTGETIISYKENERVFPASTTKIMTALTVLNDPDYNPSKVLTASSTAVDLSWDSSKIYLQEGETIVMRDALAGLLLASGNDAANVLAEALSGSTEEFSRRMTVEAFALGAINTSFMNPHGLHDENHYTTAYDLAIIASAAMKNDIFRQIVSSESYSLPASNKHMFNGWNLIMNTNRLMYFDDSYLYSPYISEVKGIKTGTTSKAGFCLVSAAETHDNRELLCVLMGVPYDEIQGSTWIYSRTLLEEAARKIGSPQVAYEDQPNRDDKTDETTGTDKPVNSETIDNETNVTDNSSVDQPAQTSETTVKGDNNDGLSSVLSDSWFWPAVILAGSIIILVIIVIVQQRKINFLQQRIRRINRK